jgi:flagellar hook-associated protein 3 FlgL
MAVNSISTYGSLQSFLQNINQSQNSLNNSQVQISSGYVSQTFDGLEGNIEQFISLNAQVTRLQNYQQGNSVVTSKLQTTNTAINQTIQVTNSIKSLIVTQMSGTSNSASFLQQLKSSQDSLISQLNITYQGNYVFGGSNTNTPPVITPIPSPVETGVPDASYYQGSTQNTSFRIADGQLLENTIRADDPAFQKIFAAISRALNSGGGGEALTQAQDLLDEGMQGLIGLQASANATLVRVRQVDTQNETVRIYYKALAESMSKSDIVALSTKVAQDQSILQASFSVFARISSLNLANYLK